MRILIAVSTLLVACGPSLASGGANCTTLGDGPRVEINAGITRGMGSPVFSLDATAVLGDSRVAEDLRNSKFSREQLAQYWLDGENLRFVLYRERTGDKFGSVEVTVETKATGDDGIYGGTWRASVSETDAGEPATFEGNITCMVE